MNGGRTRLEMLINEGRARVTCVLNIAVDLVNRGLQIFEDIMIRRCCKTQWNFVVGSLLESIYALKISKW